MRTGTSPWWPLLVALAAVLVHLGALRNGFALDDVTLVEHNPSIVSLAHLPRLFVEPYWNVGGGEHYGLFRPLTIASYAINRAITGPGPAGFHAVNVLLHGAVAALAWLALRRVGTHYGTALLGGLLFAVLPVHSEAVANIAGRAEILTALCVLAAWLAHDKGWSAAAAGLYLAAILSKESAVLAPALYLADDLTRRRVPRTGRMRRYGGYALAVGVMLALRAAALGAHQAAEDTIPLDNPAAAAGVAPRVATALWVQVLYAASCLVPVHLVSDYSFDAIPTVRTIGDPRLIAGLLLVGGMVAAGSWAWSRSRPIAIAALLWGIFFLPSSNLLFPTGTVMAERLTYLPSLGVCLVLGHAGAAAARRWRALVPVVAAGLVAVYAGRTIARVPAWRDNLTLATTDVATMPRSAKLQAGAGIFLSDAGRFAEAEEHLRRAVEIYPAYAQMHYNLAVLLVRRGARDEAVEHLERAIALAPANPRPRRLLQSLR
ncbi:MAG TPA: DUF1736 domain-containing protein [Candidatus Polarisedimenticolaceae bacterium]|nr:DUF1736 domain-containing protein [Candidatus Polarisedimenticolaceae bacterium]